MHNVASVHTRDWLNKHKFYLGQYLEIIFIYKHIYVHKGIK